jgi:hypothetical protein
MLDFYHASEHVANLARTLHPSDEEAFQQQPSHLVPSTEARLGAPLLTTLERLALDDHLAAVREVNRQETQYLRNNVHTWTIPATWPAADRSGLGRSKPPEKRRSVSGSNAVASAAAAMAPTPSVTCGPCMSANPTKGKLSGLPIPTEPNHKEAAHRSVWGVCQPRPFFSQAPRLLTPSSAPADKPLSRTPCRIALLGLAGKLREIEAKVSIFPTSRGARFCAAKLDRRDTPPTPSLWNAVNTGFCSARSGRF